MQLPFAWELPLPQSRRQRRGRCHLQWFCSHRRWCRCHRLPWQQQQRYQHQRWHQHPSPVAPPLAVPRLQAHWAGCGCSQPVECQGRRCKRQLGDTGIHRHPQASTHIHTHPHCECPPRPNSRRFTTRHAPTTPRHAQTLHALLSSLALSSNSSAREKSMQPGPWPAASVGEASRHATTTASAAATSCGVGLT